MSIWTAQRRSADVPWRDALDCIAVDGQHISTQAVSDFCSLLFLAEQVIVVGLGRNEPPATPDTYLAPPHVDQPQPAGGRASSTD
jgi:hypothetical protein